MDCYDLEIDSYRTDDLWNVWSQVKINQPLNKTQRVMQAEILASPCPRCSLQNNCSNLNCILFKAYVCGESVPDALIEHMNKARGTQ